MPVLVDKIGLDWPVEGTIVYRFGRDTLPSGGVIRWNGVGIAASAYGAVTSDNGNGALWIAASSIASFCVLKEFASILR